MCRIRLQATFVITKKEGKTFVEKGRRSFIAYAMKGQSEDELRQGLSSYYPGAIITNVPDILATPGKAPYRGPERKIAPEVIPVKMPQPDRWVN